LNILPESKDTQYAEAYDADDGIVENGGSGDDDHALFSGDGNDYVMEEGGSGNDIISVDGGEGDDIIVAQKTITEGKRFRPS
jgi:Ca2+-binding RTX toxin-like protein